jgi:Fe-S-cluster containining protein
MLTVMQRPEGDLQFIRTMDAALESAVRRAGERLACRRGCAQCCHGAFAIDELDALRLADGMDALRAGDPRLAAAVEQRAQAWIAAHGAEFPGDCATGVLGASDEERERFEDFANEAACPALDPETGSCDLYPWRPMTCRLFGPPVRTVNEDGREGLGCCELCFVGSSAEEIAACEMVVPQEVEARLNAQTGSRGETVVAFALLRSCGAAVAR